ALRSQRQPRPVLLEVEAPHCGAVVGCYCHVHVEYTRPRRRRTSGRRRSHFISGPAHSGSRIVDRAQWTAKCSPLARVPRGTSGTIEARTPDFQFSSHKFIIIFSSVRVNLLLFRGSDRWQSFRKPLSLKPSCKRPSATIALGGCWKRSGFTAIFCSSCLI